MARSRPLVPMIWLVFVTWAGFEGALALAGFCQDAARRDFGHFVRSANLWRATGNLYEAVPRVNLNPPLASVMLFTPLTWLPFDAAVWSWAFCQVASLAITLALIAHELRLTAPRMEWIIPIAVASAMTTHNWMEGQLGGLLLVGGVLAWLAGRRAREGALAASMAAVVSLKPQLGLLLLATRPRTAIRAMAFGAAGVIVGLVLLGLPVWKSWVEISRLNGLQLRPWNVSIAPVLYRAGLGAYTFDVYIPLAIAIAAITWLAASRDGDLDRRWVLWGIAALLIGPVAWVYYAAAFMGPLVAWGERHAWPLAARVGIALWLIPLRMTAAAADKPSWTLALIASPYAFGAILLWISVLSSRQPARA